MTNLQILKSIGSREGSIVLTNEISDWHSHLELWQCGCFMGEEVPSETAGVLHSLIITGLSSYGWERLRELEAESTSWGIVKKHKWKIAGGIFGIVSILWAAWLKHLYIPG